MAVVEIAKIQVRRGQADQVGMPQLDSGEFGWAIDQQRLFIGNGSLDEGAPLLGNTEIVTDKNAANFFRTATQYTYQGNIGTTVIGSVQRNIQAKLDDQVSALDFGAPNDGTAFADVAVQTAIDQIFLNGKADTRSRRHIHCPAGDYKFTGTIYIPSFTKLTGDGPNKTRFIITTSTTVLMQFVGKNSTEGNYQKFIPGSGAIGSNQEPQNIVIEGIGFVYDNSLGSTNLEPLMQIDCTRDSKIINCGFTGNRQAKQLGTDGVTGIEIRGQGSITSNNNLISDCFFENMRFGIKSKYDIEYNVIQNNRFTELFRGIEFVSDIFPGMLVGPTYTIISQNSFYLIDKEAISFSNSSGVFGNNISFGNMFKECGNDTDGFNFAVTPVIQFSNPGNITLADRFERDYKNGQSIVSGGTYVSALGGRAVQSSQIVYTQNVQQTASPIDFLVAANSGNDQKFKIQYTYVKPAANISRKGDLLVGVARWNVGSTATITDCYTYTGANDGGIDFRASYNESTNLLRVQYTATETIGVLAFSYSYLQ